MSAAVDPEPPVDPEPAAALLLRAHAEHERRLLTIDPLLRLAAPDLPDDDPGADAGDPDREPAVVLRGVGAGGASVLGLARVATTSSLWVARRAHTLTARSGDADADAWADLLDRWLARVAADPRAGEEETSASVTVPSREAVAEPALVARHFGASTVLAVRVLDDDAAPVDPVEDGGADGVSVRVAGLDDLDLLADWSARLHAWEAGLGHVPPRPEARAVVRDELAEALERDRGWTWVAEVEGEPVGMCQVLPPDVARWATDAVSLMPTGYLAAAFVEPGRRSSGVGRRLVAHAHARAVEEGWAAMVLHHAASSPYSTPFWGARGYRPLLTTYQRRPAVLAQNAER